jgi:hypothetical protein
MNNFKYQCIGYLLVNGWVRDHDGWEWAKISPCEPTAHCETLGQALDIQLEWDDEYEASTRVD